MLAILVLFAVILSVTWWRAHPQRHEERVLAGVGRLAGQLLPPPDRSPEQLRVALEALSGDLLSDVSLYDASGRLLAAVGETVPLAGDRRRRWGERGAFVLEAELPDGRTLAARHRMPDRDGAPLALFLVSLTLAIALGAWPLVRRLTRRLERLRTRVEALGAGDLSARVDVEGRDEVAALARSFNRAAERIEQLVDAQRAMLAGASHELRSPLARIRMAIELLAGDARPELRARIESDIAELDGGIDELLLASRLDAAPELSRREPVDLLALLAEEAARTGASVAGSPVSVVGDARLLRRLLRNLLENASRHGGGAPVDARVDAQPDGGARVRIEDGGPGIPAEERERIFEPFYRLAGTRETGSGVGLGLSLVRRIARHHGGTARCERGAEGGTRFVVELPGEAPRTP
jgi:signal transduction histidine kinase